MHRPAASVIDNAGVGRDRFRDTVQSGKVFDRIVDLDGVRTAPRHGRP
jgi:hypothetical protein